MKLIFAVLDVSLTMGLTRCYKTEGFFTFIRHRVCYFLRLITGNNGGRTEQKRSGGIMSQTGLYTCNSSTDKIPVHDSVQQSDATTKILNFPSLRAATIRYSPRSFTHGIYSDG